MKSKAYTRAGVDIDLANRLKHGLPRLLAAARRPEVLGRVGGFGGLFALPTARYARPVLVSSVDGVGTKLKIAFALDRHDSVGQDLVNHCVNDIAVLGAEPLFFLDYIGTGELEPRVFTELLRGLARACAQNRCALLGGETAQMPGFYRRGEYDLSGAIVGVVERDRLLDGRTIRPGDAVVGLASSGLHTNGYSLARDILFRRMKLKPRSYLAELGRTVGDELLKVHRSYGPLVQALLKRFNGSSHRPPPASGLTPRPGGPRAPRSGGAPRVAPPIRALAHITGGGFIDNIPRVLPRRCDVVIRQGSWEVPPLFRILRDRGRVPETDCYQVFNMGVGMVLIVDPGQADAVLRFVRQSRQRAWIIGEVLRGRGGVRLA